MLNRSLDLFKIAVVLALVLLLFMSSDVSARSSCICYYVGDCVYDMHGGMYRYSQCTGNCYAYSGYRFEPKCRRMRTADSAGRSEAPRDKLNLLTNYQKRKTALLF